MENLMKEMSVKDMKEVNGGGFLKILSFEDGHMYLFGMKIF